MRVKITAADAERIAQQAVRNFGKALLACAEKKLEHGDQVVRLEVLCQMIREALDGKD